MRGRVKTGVVPPSGWHFLQEGKFRIEASGYDELLSNVTRWRVENSRPVGNVAVEVDNYICQNYPRQCGEQGAATGPFVWQAPQVSKTQKFVDLLGIWAASLMRRPEVQTLETQGEAEKRAAICLACPKNMAWEEGCPTCIENVRRVTTIIRQGKDVPIYRKLKGCSVKSHCNRTAIWLRKECFSDSEGTPEECWIRKLK